MLTASSGASRSPQRRFRALDRAVERRLGVDLRLIYGMGAPILAVVGMIIAFSLSPSTWLLVVILALELAALVVIGVGLASMLNDRDEDADPPS